ncbi:hypothetical protein [Acanthopleuribacter pedis]|uniref:Uncharacterized protein n=1 Tax=Acanthopleuribacter pedis TaxID=442870 RepID=A0A8J7QQX9_9BACT|nr:hypothetical protein [Acanthopleuribacter pedis]MBO1323210.1 hypothetical protein [Acanthopleuribacter pedis]
MATSKSNDNKRQLMVNIPANVREAVDRICKEQGYTLTQFVTDALRTQTLILDEAEQLRKQYPNKAIRLRVSFDIDDEDLRPDKAALLYY